MKLVTIKIVTVEKDFSQADKAFLCRFVTALQSHNLSVMVTYSSDRHRKKLQNIILKTA